MAALSADEPTDEALVARCRTHDDAAVRALISRYNRRLYRIARSIVRDDSEAEDVVQAAYVRAFTELHRFRGDAAFGTWLTRIAVNEALGRLRRRRPIAPMVDTAAGDDANPERAMAQQELHALLERSIDRLPSTFRTVFVARMVEGLSVEETAVLFDLRPETVKTRVHRARARLKADLTRHLGPLVTGAFAFDGARCSRMTEQVMADLRRLEGRDGPS